MKNRRNDKILVVAGTYTTWERDKKPHTASNELIAAGVATIDNGDFSVEIVEDPFYIKPVTSDISEYCTRKTGITNEEVNEVGMTFEEFAKCMEENFHARDRCWATYGDYTRKVIYYQSRNRQIWNTMRYPFGDRHFNIKNLFGLVFSPSAEYNLNRSLEHLGLQYDGDPQCVNDIAFNQACLLAGMLKTLRANQHMVAENIGGLM